MKRINPKNIVRLYKMNRLWGDTIFEASYYALRGKAFVTSYNGLLLNKQIIAELKQNPDINGDGEI